MHLTLTDHLTCPRCGPATGLILFMERAHERRVVSGSLGCPVCRAQYPIRDRVADLRVHPSALGPQPSAASDAGGRAPERAPRVPTESAAELALRVAALTELGAAGAGGFVLLAGPVALETAAELARFLPDVEPVVAVEDAAVADAALPASTLLTEGALPLADRTMRAVVHVGGVPDEARVAELVRVARPTARLVIETAGAADAAALDAVADQLQRSGARVRARDDRAVVAVAM